MRATKKDEQCAKAWLETLSVRRDRRKRESVDPKQQDLSGAGNVAAKNGNRPSAVGCPTRGTPKRGRLACHLISLKLAICGGQSQQACVVNRRCGHLVPSAPLITP